MANNFRTLTRVLNKYSVDEFGEKVDTSDYYYVPILWSTMDIDGRDEDLEIIVNYMGRSILYELGGKVYAVETFTDTDEIARELKGCDFDSLYARACELFHLGTWEGVD